ncbi:3-phytase [Novosphingobium chloroacetimidivorans]|uniref:3-phytase n=1 Tax=Novosphingobium chloroacetimidivorans TaxID=1428314 RepID=A0A7W7NUJ0_9SPHN|nr:phytase [Novosphingobium chloroacetimidivorans]MBB4857558.1 3-phytase [Novosphingobium chloroacetimidivorans]
MRRVPSAILTFAFALLAGCAEAPVSAPLAQGASATVTARGETVPVGTGEDAADDPAIWRNPRRPADSLVVATDKRAGLHLYDLAGRHLDFAPSPRLNNVDLRADVALDGGRGIIVAASDRANEAQARIALFRLDSAARKLVPLGNPAAGAGEAYGLCLWRRASDKALFAFVVMKDGRIDQFRIGAEARPSAQLVRQLRLGTQSEGCVADDRTGMLYVAEEDVGIWRFAADPSAPATPVPGPRVDRRFLVADAEGLAIAPKGRSGGWLIGSSQGDDAYAVWRLPDLKPVGRFRIGAGQFGATSQTDGIEIALGNFGPEFPKGLMVAQDGDNAPSMQNFKLVSWDDIAKALHLK